MPGWGIFFASQAAFEALGRPLTDHWQQKMRKCRQFSPHRSHPIQLKHRESDLPYTERGLLYTESDLSYTESHLLYPESNLSYTERHLLYTESNLLYPESDLPYTEGGLRYAERDLPYTERQILPFFLPIRHFAVVFLSVAVLSNRNSGSKSFLVVGRPTNNRKSTGN